MNQVEQAQVKQRGVAAKLEAVERQIAQLGEAPVVAARELAAARAELGRATEKAKTASGAAAKKALEAVGEITVRVAKLEDGAAMVVRTCASRLAALEAEKRDLAGKLAAAEREVKIARFRDAVLTYEHALVKAEALRLSDEVRAAAAAAGVPLPPAHLQSPLIEPDFMMIGTYPLGLIRRG